MIVTINNILSKLLTQPRTIFLIDGIGASLSALLLIGLIAPFDYIFGMPQKIIYNLAIIAFAFTCYSLSCYFLNIKKWKFFLRIIAFANLLYCCITLGLLINQHKAVTELGVVYFSGEIMLILLITTLELAIIRKTPPA